MRRLQSPGCKAASARSAARSGPTLIVVASTALTALDGQISQVLLGFGCHAQMASKESNGVSTVTANSEAACRKIAQRTKSNAREIA